MAGGVYTPTEIVSAIHHALPRHARRCIHTHRNCFSNLWSPSAASGMGICPKCFGNLLFPTEACQEVPTMRRQLAMPYRESVGRWLCPMECALGGGYTLPTMHQQVTIVYQPCVSSWLYPTKNASAGGYALWNVRRQVAMPYGMCVGSWLCPT